MNVENWVWCLHCERCSMESEWIGGDCPYGDCDGSILDMCDWSSIREHHLEYPTIPLMDKIYPLYGRRELC
jgi:hypothetical protein